jgi:hypothetical protein
MALDPSTITGADEIRGSVDRLTAAVLTLAMETVSAATGHSAGDVTDAVKSKAMDLYRSTHAIVLSGK